VRFKLEESLPDLFRLALKGLGHDAHTVAEEGMAGARDEHVLQACRVEDGIFITLDLYFADIRSYPPGSYPGIWVLRPAKQIFREIESLVRAGIRLASVPQFASSAERLTLSKFNQPERRGSVIGILSYPEQKLSHRLKCFQH
jgi:predicted nuclease of predicted toxin-antitoxin system